MLAACCLVTVAQAEEEDEARAMGEVVVTATRSHRLVKDQAVRVEVVPQEELEENSTVSPGNLSNLLNELAGARMDAGSAGLGGSALRLRGLPGRHAQILFDGLALGGAQSDSFSMLQVPPIDLQRVELIKGVASALYGGSALAGVVNLVSRPAGSDSEWMVSQSDLGGSDADVFYGGDAARGFTLTGSAHYQSRHDLDHDGWAELPGFERLTLRPRWSWGDAGDRGYATLGFTGEDRTGGTTGDNTVPGGGTFPASLDTRRVDAGWTRDIALTDGRTLGFRMSGDYVARRHAYGAAPIDDHAADLAAETIYQGRAGAHEWTLGGALAYDALTVADVAGIDYSYGDLAVFAQDEFSPADWLALTVSARVDAHSDFGTVVSPRLSALFRLDPDVSLRASVGTGFAAATPLIDEVDDLGFGPLDPLRDVREERASSASLDLQWLAKPFDVNLSVFGSEVRHPLNVEESTTPGRIVIRNDREPLRVRGAELLVGCAIDDLHLLASSTWLDVTEEAPDGGRRRAELVPEYSAELAGILEFEGHGRAGIEISLTGPQELHDDPNRTRTPPLLEINALAEITFGKYSVFVNALNLTDEKQSDHDPVLRPAGEPGLGGNPVTESWASLVGRNFNVGLRAKF